MEIKSPPTCPNTITVRRNPPRRARPTPYSAAPLSLPSSSKTSSAIRSFPIQDILSIDVPDKPEIAESSSEPSDSEKLRVFLRIRPIATQQKVGPSVKNGAQKNVWPQNPRKKDASKTAKAAGKKKSEICLRVNDSHSVTLCPPQSMTDVRRTKSEVYEGFSHVFYAESSQSEVYEKMVNPLVDEFLKGKSGMLAAMGPSGSGKTHTVFGNARDPGMVSLALRQIFAANEKDGSKCSRTFYLSMFEIYSERGKGEKIMDLSPEGGDLFMQQSVIKGLQEAVIHDIQQAESLIASGMLKRSTATTNSNIQSRILYYSGRSQCIINIRCDLDEDIAIQSCPCMLTIVDLAGAEREKKTGNQGARLLESNFINNTSMVFGLCLRSLLEHQKNPKKPFQKHFQNSMLTKYLRDFLEGKKRMALIITAKAGEEDYQDTSYLLRQASPFMNIKFENIEEQPANTFGNKRRTQTLSKTENAKKMKINNNNQVSMDDEVKAGNPHKDLTPEKDKEVEFNGSLAECPVIIDDEANENKENITDSVELVRQNQILSKFSRALWNVLKDYKNKLEASEKEVSSLKDSLNVEKQRITSLESELNLMKASCSCGKEENGSENCQSVDVNESIAQTSSSHPIKLECSKNSIDITSPVVLLHDCSDLVNQNQVDEQVSCSNICEEEEYVDNYHQWGDFYTPTFEKNCEYVVFAKEDLKEIEFNNEIAAGCDMLELVVSDSEEEEYQSKAQVSSSSPSESECFQQHDDTVTIDEEISSVEIISVSSCDYLEAAVSNSELIILEEKNTKGDHEDENSNAGHNESDFFEKQDILEDTKIDISSSVSDKQELKEVEETEANGEVTGYDSAGQSSELTSVIGEEDGQISELTSVIIEEAGQDSELTSVIGVEAGQDSELTYVIGEETGQNSELTSIIVEEAGQNSELTSVIGVEAVQISELTSVIEVGAGHIVELTSVIGEEAGQNSELTFVTEDEAGQNSELTSVIEDEAGQILELTSVIKDEAGHSSELSSVIGEEAGQISELTSVIGEEAGQISELTSVIEDEAGQISELTSVIGEEAGQNSELPSVVGDEVSTTFEEDRPEHKEKEVISDQQNKDVISFQSSEVPSVQPCQSNPVKPKRRLRPASSVMLRNINILDFDDATEMPKQSGKRGEKEDFGSKRTQGSNTLLQLLKQNLHH